MWSMYESSLMWKRYVFLFSFSPVSRARFSICCAGCHCGLLGLYRRSVYRLPRLTHLIEQLRWNSSGAVEIPNCMGVHLYLPYAVQKVVRCLEFSVNFTCRKPSLASHRLNTLASARFSTREKSLKRTA